MSAILTHAPRLHPERAETLAMSECEGPGFWAGAAGAWLENGELTVVYRLRRPRPERGHRLRIVRRNRRGAVDTLWEATRLEMATQSVERCAIVHDPRGAWRLWVSCVDEADGRWRIDVMEAPSPDQFCVARRRPVLTAASTGTEGVKDPVIYLSGGLYYLYASIATALSGADHGADALHATGDVFATGLLRSATALAISQDAERWHWAGEVLSPRPGAWDAYAARITAVWPSGPGYLAFYDGSQSVEDNYEERAGLACSADLRTWHRVSLDGPVARSPWGTGSLRYVEVVGEGRDRVALYELCLPDGSHELRLQALKPLGG
ncbi:MAG TPA: hypothetical protein VLH79_10235 [Chthonomonadales bacterium]|nr:hypothetical protein [Chthonomonadales bacterium]